MSKSFVSGGLAILGIVGYPISSIPAGENTEVIQQIHLGSAGTDRNRCAPVHENRTLKGAIA